MQAPRMRAKRPILNAMKNPRVHTIDPFLDWKRTIDPFASACPASAPYVCSGFPGQCSAYPVDHPLHGIDCTSYATPQQHVPGVAGAGTFGYAAAQQQQYVRGPQVRYGERQGNPRVHTIDPFLDWKRTIDPFASTIDPRTSRSDMFVAASGERYQLEFAGGQLWIVSGGRRIPLRQRTMPPAGMNLAAQIPSVQACAEWYDANGILHICCGLGGYCWPVPKKKEKPKPGASYRRPGIFSRVMNRIAGR